MGDVTPIGKARKTAAKKAGTTRGETAAAASTLCRNGHHRWKVWKNLPFDVRQGKLVTVYRCERCGKQRSAAE